MSEVEWGPAVKWLRAGSVLACSNSKPWSYRKPSARFGSRLSPISYCNSCFARISSPGMEICELIRAVMAFHRRG